MKRLIFLPVLCFAAVLLFAGCDPEREADLGAPPPAQVEHEQDGAGFKVAHPEQFPLAERASTRPRRS